MGDIFRTIVDCDASSEEAPALAQQVRKSLIAQRIIKEIPTSECVLGAPKGYPPGSRFALALDQTEDPDGVFADNTLDLTTNGLEIVTERRFFWGGGEIFCPRCGKKPETWTGFQDASADWDNLGSGLLKCAACRHVESITNWKYDPPAGYGNLGFTFWNWPPLSKLFVNGISEFLGHRTVVVTGKL